MKIGFKISIWKIQIMGYSIKKPFTNSYKEITIIPWVLICISRNYICNSIQLHLSWLIFGYTFYFSFFKKQH